MRPLLFLFFINDVESFVGVDMRFYADDCILFQEVNNRKRSADTYPLSRTTVRVTLGLAVATQY